MSQLVDAPHIFPGRSLLGETRGPLVDTDVEMVVGGRVYLTRLELTEYGRHFGLVEGEVHERTIAEKDDRIGVLEAQLAEAHELLAGWQPVVESFKLLAADVGVTVEVEPQPAAADAAVPTRRRKQRQAA